MSGHCSEGLSWKGNLPGGAELPLWDLPLNVLCVGQGSTRWWGGRCCWCWEHRHVLWSARCVHIL